MLQTDYMDVNKLPEACVIDRKENVNIMPFENIYTREECAIVEIDYMLEELRTNYKYVIEECEKETEGRSNYERVANNTDIIMKKYERPKDSNLPKRQEAADIWYAILTGENDEK